ncbi:MAG: SPFH domain-containing protein [Polyangiaceae bacterium]|nr:SPFH domain-containing protein [Polyangiaceae bacterium]
MTFLSFVVGFASIVGVALVSLVVFKGLTIRVEDEEAILVTRFGKLAKVVRTPGLHFCADRWAPWVRLIHVSLARDYREFVDVHVHDAEGTTVLVDVWLEVRVEDPVRATFAVSDWDHALRNLVSHAITSIFGDRKFSEILRSRTELGSRLEAEIGDDLKRWGIKIEQAYLRNVGLRPEVERQILHSVSAQLERAKADVDERGRIAVAHLEAETRVRISDLVASAKGQYPEAVGRAYEAMSERKAVRAAYDELYKLAQLSPGRMVAFLGFDGMRAIDAMMIPEIGAGQRLNGKQANGNT